MDLSKASKEKLIELIEIKDLEIEYLQHRLKNKKFKIGALKYEIEVLNLQHFTREDLQQLVDMQYEQENIKLKKENAEVNKEMKILQQAINRGLPELMDEASSSNIMKNKMDKEYVSHMERLLREKEEEIERIQRELINTKMDLHRSNDELYVVKTTMENPELYTRAEETFEIRRHVERLQQKIAQLTAIIKNERAAATAATHAPNLEEEISSNQGPSKNIFKTRSRSVYDIDNKVYFIEGECRKKGKGKLDEGTSGGETRR